MHSSLTATDPIYSVLSAEDVGMPIAGLSDDRAVADTRVIEDTSTN
jgi:hypothetical protein